MFLTNKSKRLYACECASMHRHARAHTELHTVHAQKQECS